MRTMKSSKKIIKKYPKVLIHTRLIYENVKKSVEKCAEMNISVMGITKVSDGLAELNKAYINANVKYLGLSRLEQLQDARNQGIQIPLVLIRIPMLSEVETMLEACDISLQSELGVLKKTNEIALKKSKVHKVILMVDLGDLREGFWDRNELLDAAEKVEKEMDGLYLYGIGTNLGCYGAIAPTVDKMEELAAIAESIEQRLGRKLDVVSVGGSTSLMRVWKKDMPKGVNNIRVGGVPFMPRRNAEAFGEYYGYGMNRDTVRIQAEIVSIKEKIVYLALGTADYGDWNELRLKDESLKVIGATHDLTFVDVSKSEKEYKLGDIIEFDGTYTTLVYLAKSRSVVKEYVE